MCCWWKGAYIKSLTHPPSLHRSPTALVTIATEGEVGIFFFFFFKGQAAAQGTLDEITTPHY